MRYLNNSILRNEYVINPKKFLLYDFDLTKMIKNKEQEIVK